MKRITFRAEDEDVRLLERFQRELAGASASAVIRLALRKMNAGPAIETRSTQPAILIPRREANA